MSMFRAVAAVALTHSAVASGIESGSQVTPVQKVLQLMEGMLAKGKEDKHAEQLQFATYKQFCDDTTAEKQKLITIATARIETLKADIEKYISTAARLTKEIAEHTADIAGWEGDMKAAAEVRATQKADYDTLHKDYSESISALERAIEVLKKQAYDRAQGEEVVTAADDGSDGGPIKTTVIRNSYNGDSSSSSSSSSTSTSFSLAQVSALTKLKMIPDDAKDSIGTYLAQIPEVKGYEFQSHGIIEMLEKLLDKFYDERTAIEKEESNAKHAFDMFMQDTQSQVEQAQSDRKDKTQAKAKTLSEKATAVGDLQDTTAARKADQKYLDDLVATCEEKSASFESRQQLRTEELEAINKAMEIISSGAVQGSAEKHLPSLAQEGTALAMLRADSKNAIIQSRVAEFLSTRGRDLDSRVLSALAQHVTADPFGKVKKMIQDLLTRLMEEANGEADHKGWCDTELTTNAQTRKEKSETVERLHFEIDELQASNAKLTADISDLTAAIADLDKAMSQATELRHAESAKNKQTVADAKAAQEAVSQALTVLKEFYEKAGDATALVQQQPEAPEIFDKEYKGMQAENGGVIGMLEVIMSDFSRLQADTESSEAVAQKEYDSFMTDSQVDKSSKSTELEHKDHKRQKQESALVEKNDDLDGTQKELDSALAYFDKLKPPCVNAGVSIEDRVARRKQEVQSLQEALRILSGEEMA